MAPVQGDMGLVAPVSQKSKKLLLTDNNSVFLVSSHGEMWDDY